MIAGLRGTVDDVGPDWLTVNVGGVVYRVFAASSTLSALPAPGAPVGLHTHLQMREDGLTLYGFAGKAELRTFQLLLSVNGVGPRSALALLSAMPVDSLALAIAAEDVARLSSVPGIGKRTAARIALELKGKLGQLETGSPTSPTSATAAQLVAALTSLGYTGAEAASAVRSVPNLAVLDLEEALREALRVISSR